jgi:hypothetical protein
MRLAGGWSGGVLAEGDDDVVAEGLEQASGVAGLAAAVGVPDMPVGAEVGVPGGGVVQQVPDDECDTRSHMLRVNLADWRASMT